MAALLALLALAAPLWAAPPRAARRPAAPFLRVLTFNVAGIPIVHAHWGGRLHALASALKDSPYDVVAIQEIWRDVDGRTLAEESGFPYAARYNRSIELGTGLLILSRWPILEKHEARFTCRPSIIRIPQGESFANKGALMVRVQTPRGTLDVWTAHLISDYPSAGYQTLRRTQLFEFSEAVERLSRGRPTIVMGDFNMSPDEPEYALFADLLGLENACATNAGAPCGPTNDNGRQIDHVFLPRGGRRGQAVMRTTLGSNVPGEAYPYSDHLAVEAALDSSVMALRISPDPGPRAAALARVQSSLRGMIEQMLERLKTRGWVPVYGFLMSLRYGHQLPQLVAIKARVETSRIRAVALR